MKLLGFIYAIAAAVTWGLVYTLDHKILTRATPLAYLFINSIFSALIILPVLWGDRHSIGDIFNSGKANLSLITLSLFLAMLANFFIFSGIKILGAPTASIFEIAYPFFVVLFSALLFREAVSEYFIIGASLIFAGAFIIIRLG